jgi:hypothetical protein
MPSVVGYTDLQIQPIEIQERAAGAANDWYAGDLVANDTNGELVIATAGVIAAIARKAATGTASTLIPIELLQINEIYVARYKASATGETLIGDCLDFTFTAGAHTLDESGATTDVYCVGLHPDDGALTSGRLLVRFYGTLFTATAT